MCAEMMRVFSGFCGWKLSDVISVGRFGNCHTILVQKKITNLSFIFVFRFVFFFYNKIDKLRGIKVRFKKNICFFAIILN